MALKALDLFKAYTGNKLPTDGGFIVSSFFTEGSAYSRYEIIAYPSVKSLFLTEEGLTFQSDGNKLYVLVEPASYPRKFIEPFRRDNKEKIPQRFSELNILTTKSQTKVMVSKNPIMTWTSFTVFRPSGNDFAFVFLKLADAHASIKSFFQQSLNREAGVPTFEAGHAAELVVEAVKRFTIFDAAPPAAAPAAATQGARKPPSKAPTPAKAKARAKAKVKARARPAPKAKPKAKAKARPASKAKPKVKAKAKGKPRAKPKAGARKPSRRR